MTLGLTEEQLRIPAAMARRYLRRHRMPPGQEIEDLESAGRLGLVRSALRFDAGRAPQGEDGKGPWLCRGVRLAIGNLATTSRARKHTGAVQLGEEAPDLIADPRASCPQALAERSDLARRALSLLAPRHRELILLRFWEGLSRGEVAAIWGVCRNAVEQMEAGVLRRLRKHLEDHP